MPRSRFTTSQDARAAKAKSVAHARKIVDDAKAADRELSSTERSRVEELVEEAKAHEFEAKDLEGDEKLRDDLSSLFGRPTGPAKAGRRGDGTWAKSMTTFLGRVGAKALVPSGSITVPSLSAGITATQD